MNSVVLVFLLLLAVPLFFLVRDLRATLERYNLLGRDEAGHPVQQGDASYVRAARRVFKDHPEVSVFVFGHTHSVLLKTLESGRVVLNTGTWLKLFHKIPVLLGYLPPVYCPAYQISTFRIVEEDGEAVIYYRQIPKTASEELTWLQRLLAAFRRIPAPASVPRRTVVRPPPSGSVKRTWDFEDKGRKAQLHVPAQSSQRCATRRRLQPSLAMRPAGEWDACSTSRGRCPR